jgi:SAM-dependent methyltransferase
MALPPDDWWRTWFDAGYLALYDRELAERTPKEIDQLEALLAIRPPLRVLDLPTGQGRHAIELARRGYEVTAVDLSPYMLSIARHRASEAGVRIRLLEGEMRQPLEGKRFDLVLNLFTSLGYFAEQADDRKVVAAAHGMLVDGGRFVLEVINGEQLMRTFREREWFTVGDTTVLEHRRLDRASRRMIVERTVKEDDREETKLHAIRLYGPQEVRRLLEQASFGAIQLYGDWDASPASANSTRVLAVGEKRKGGS